jgi:hypothetical protein
MKCAYHPTLDAVATCSACGKAICPNCLVDTGSRVMCRACVESRSRAAAAYGPGYNQLAIWSMVLGLSGWALVCMSYILSFVVSIVTLGLGAICTIPLSLLPLVAWIVGIILGHRGLNELDAPGNEKGGRGMAITGLIASYGGLGISLLLCLLAAAGFALGLSIPFLEGMMNP